MRRTTRTPLAGLMGSLVAVAGLGTAAAAERETLPGALPALARRAQAITDAVLTNHIDPPTRQEMILSGVGALCRAAGRPRPDGLAARVSAVTTRGDLTALLAEVWPLSTALISVESLEDSFLEGLLAVVPGDAELVPGKERAVAEQFAGNRYVGLHIALGYDQERQRPQIKEVFEGGPADRAGIVKDDVLESIDDVDTRNMDVREAVDRLRGAEGTAVAVAVRRPGAPEARTLTITRGTLPRATIVGCRQLPSKEWVVRVDDPDSVGYLKITELVASTPHELRRMARRLESEGAKALVLDLRGLNRAELQPAVLLADELLTGGTIGRIKEAGRVREFSASEDALFRGWPMAVLIDGETSGPAEWLAAALQDNNRATLVGVPTACRAEVTSGVPFGDGTWTLTLTTGRLQRGDGRPIGPFSGISQRFGPARIPLQRAGRRGERRADDAFGVMPDHLVGMSPNEARRVRSRSANGAVPTVADDREAAGRILEPISRASKDGLESMKNEGRDPETIENLGRLADAEKRASEQLLSETDKLNIHETTTNSSRRTGGKDPALDQAVGVLREALRSS